MPLQDPTYQELMRLAMQCLAQSRSAFPELAQELRQMAEEYQRRAAELNGGKPPDAKG
jgi:hypothetical protein